MLELLNNPISTCSQKVRLTLFEKGLEFTDTRIDFRAKEHLTPEYLALNPDGVVPTLLHDGQPVLDSSVIMEYLDEVFPEVPLSPPTPLGRAKMRKWLRFIEEVPTAAIRIPSFNQVFIRHRRDLSEAELASDTEKRTLRRTFYQEMGRHGFSEARLDESLERLRETVARMDAALADNRWLTGEALTLADFCVVPTIDRMRDLGLSGLWDEQQNFTRWWAAIEARPAFARTYAQGTRVSDIYQDLKETA
ncbi:glutathione S-transferase family protein [Pseudooceanicola sp.]|uniref:glutathione S-transferase family protein n=1 Tax=Pseudooceanicola sp. TaxID=1914328 RepID=UPI00261FE795|nr:glutathione S-transferase family protein [Pseudooceanicola sp.]MDF1854069.1 glutathione S-transferase family protein [Pseudooceanicola sp.]